MKKIGILAFYIKIDYMAPEDVDHHIEEFIKVLSPDDKEDVMNLWHILCIPIRDGQDRIQVIRNDGLNSQNDINLNDLTTKLQNSGFELEISKLTEKLSTLENQIVELQQKTKKRSWF